MTQDAPAFDWRALPLLFRAPPGWQQPTTEWMALNQGWRPAAQEEPSQYPPAPKGWAFWVQNEPAWGQLVAQARSKARTSMLVNGLIAFVGLVVSVGWYLLAATSGGTHLVFWGAVLFGLIGLVRSAVRLHRAEDEAYVAAVMWSRELRLTSPTVHR